jgi:hypothetical protein
MDGVVIDRITATCVYPLSSSNDTVQKPDEWFTVWERKGTSVLEWSNGSTHPIALRVDSNAVKTFSINLGFEGSCTFPSAYPRDPPKFQCKLVGSLEEENVTFTSEAFDVELKPDPKNGSQPPPETHPFDTGLMEVTSPLPESVCRVPFRIAGDIKWKIVKVQPEGAPSMGKSIFSLVVLFLLILLKLLTLLECNHSPDLQNSRAPIQQGWNCASC